MTVAVEVVREPATSREKMGVTRQVACPGSTPGTVKLVLVIAMPWSGNPVPSNR
jgi:hypothetical protein